MARKTKSAVAVDGKSKVGRPVGPAEIAEQKPLRPGQCRAYMRRTLAQEFPAIVDGFVKGAKRGSCQHMKMTTVLLGPTERKRTRRKGTVTQLLEKLDREGL